LLLLSLSLLLALAITTTVGCARQEMLRRLVQQRQESTASMSERLRVLVRNVRRWEAMVSSAARPDRALFAGFGAKRNDLEAPTQLAVDVLSATTVRLTWRHRRPATTVVPAASPMPAQADVFQSDVELPADVTGAMPGDSDDHSAGVSAPVEFVVSIHNTMTGTVLKHFIPMGRTRRGECDD
jgi:hypothetical protein